MNRQRGPGAPHVVELLGASEDAPDADARAAARLMERLVGHLGQGGALRFTVLMAAEGAMADRLRSLGVEVVVVPMPEDPPWHAIQVLVGLIRSREVDVLHAHLPAAHRLAGLAGRITGAPVLCTVQGPQIDMPDLEVHRMIGSQLSVVSEASYFHALGLGIDPERLGCDAFDADADEPTQAASLQAVGRRLYGLAVQAAVAPVDPVADAGGATPSRGLAQARALVQPLRPAR
ncbi:glycosyltransferase [Roseateles chitosanitabidus]|uniref:glycosyltransferase n=1 Tax=Roseateles chitosanitabidus TaxID=65048 RepID=UPI00082CBEC9|nr:glycosyltransferase [Roseateles chitosanitabidus]MBO9687216.1 hypothetical protein [Roseateles chitosanitabidus]